MDWPGVEFHRVAANGVEFEVATLPPAKEDTGKLALCLHGFPECAYSWRLQMPMLAALGYRVWAPNLRGYGGSSCPTGVDAYRTQTLVDDVAGLIAASGATDILLLAHDWGGVLAWALAIERPELVQRLIVCNLPHPACFQRELRRPPQMFMSWYMALFQLPRLPEWLLTRNRAAAVSQMFLRTARDKAKFPREVTEVYRANALRPGGMTAMLHWYRALRRPGGLRDIVAKHGTQVKVPTLFLWGDADVALSIKTTDGTEKYVPDLTFRVLPGVSHWVQQDAPETVNAMIEAWVKGEPVPTGLEDDARTFLAA
jgi:pimeloyl-ACP methyl ester carboxylesterase